MSVNFDCHPNEASMISSVLISMEMTANRFARRQMKNPIGCIRHFEAKAVTVVILFAAFSCASAQTHCKSQEDVVFSCKLQKSRKVVSLCATSQVVNGKMKTVALQYRFGKPNTPRELEFPLSGTGSLEQFKLNEYFGSQVFSTNISFTIGEFDYAVNDSEEQRIPSFHMASVTVVSRVTNKQLDLRCETKSVYSDWGGISGVVPCDENATMNACEYKK